MIIRNIIPQSLQEEIINLTTSNNFAWFFNDAVVINRDHMDNMMPGFTHIFYSNNQINSEHCNVVKPLLYFIEQHLDRKIKSIYRMQANLMLNTHVDEKYLDNHIHKDVGEDDLDAKDKYKNYVTALYYVIDSDGETVLYEDNKTDIKEQHIPKQGSCLIFDSMNWHRASSPLHYKKRIALNIVLELEE